MRIDKTVRRGLRVFVAACFGMLALAGSVGANDYYVDCSGGDDLASGLTSAAPWASLDRVNAIFLSAGDHVLLRRGTVCDGVLRLQGSGDSTQFNVLAAYGVGPRPIVRAGAQADAAIRLSDQEYWEIRNLEVVGGRTYGIHVTGVAGRPLRGIRIIDTHVHDVHGLVTNKESGLVVVSPGAPGTVFEDVLIDGVDAHDTTQWAGILVGGDDFGATPTSPRSSNVIVRNSLVHHVAGDGIALFQVEQGLLEMNVAYETGLAPDTSVGTPNGIWTWMCHDCVVQFNEGYRTHSPGVDGGVYDIDYGCTDTVVRYNYAHDADGYCVSVFAAYWPTQNSRVHHNVCANNGRDASKVFQGDIYLLTWAGGVLDGVQVFNNTIYWSPAATAPAVNAGGRIQRVSSESFFKNNVVISTVPAAVHVGPQANIDFDHNLYWYTGAGSPTWDVSGQLVSSLSQWQGLGFDANGIVADPKIRGPYSSALGLHRFFFMLSDVSPAIDRGTAIPIASFSADGVAPDVFGAATDIGAFEWETGLPLSMTRGQSARPRRGMRQ